MSEQAYLRLAIIQWWMSGAMFGLSVAGLITGVWVVGLMIVLSPLSAVLAQQNWHAYQRQRAS